MKQFSLFWHPASFALGVALATAACSAPPGKGDSEDPGGPGGNGDGDAFDPDVTGMLPDGTDVTALMPARIRRLTNAEYDASVQSLLGTAEAFGTNFPPDTRQQGYSVNEAQRVDPILARALDTSAIALAEEATAKLDILAPCADFASGALTCAGSFIDDFVTQAYRRPVSTEERDGLLLLYGAATSGEGAAPGATPEELYADGIALIIRGVLQSPGFLYLTETGGVEPEGTIQMTGHEIASELSYLFSGGPPDGQLLAAAESGALLDGASREAEVRRLIASPQGADRAVKVIKQWLGIDRIAVTDKDATVYPDFAAVRDAMDAQTSDFVKGSLEASGASLFDLLGKEHVPNDPTLAGIYAAGGPARTGLLNQGAFLSVYSQAHETSPVLRGVALMRRLACIDIEIPLTLDVEIVPPVPDPTQTTRERFGVHSADAGCANCHNLIDPLGFSFEQFDAMGAYRAEENSKPVDSSSSVVLGKDFDGPYAGSTELASALAVSEDVAHCFARQLFRANSGEGVDAEDAEEAFIATWNTLSAEERSVMTETLVALAASDLFVFRRNP